MADSLVDGVFDVEVETFFEVAAEAFFGGFVAGLFTDLEGDEILVSDQGIAEGLDVVSMFDGLEADRVLSHR